MIGADVERLRSLAAQFDDAARRLRQQAAQVSNGVQVAAWFGPVAVRFRHDWDSSHSVSLRSTAASLDDAAKVLRQNADQQEAASATLAGNAGTSVVVAQARERAVVEAAGRSLLDRSGSFLGDVVGGAVGVVGDAVDTARGVIDPMVGFVQVVSDFHFEALKNFRGTISQLEDAVAGWARVARPLGIVGNVFTVLDIGEGLAAGDDGKLITGGVSAVASKLPGHLKIAAGAALLYGSVTMPVTDAEIDGAFEHTMKKRFPDYDPANPTQEQANWSVKRYEGPIGFLNSISDGMDYKLRWIGG